MHMEGRRTVEKSNIQYILPDSSRYVTADKTINLHGKSIKTRLFHAPRFFLFV